MRRRAILWLAIVIPAFAFAGCGFLVRTVDSARNRVDGGTVASSPAHDDFDAHRGLFVADMHADTLLWNRDLSERVSRGHVDAPRLREGNVSLQVFTVPTKFVLPRRRAAGEAGTSHDGEGARCYDGVGLNLMTPLAILSGWPRATWFDLEARAMHMAKILGRYETVPGAPPDSTHPIRVVRSRADLEALMDAWRRGEAPIGAILGLEGVSWLGEDRITPDVRAAEAGVDRLYQAGFRQISLTIAFDNGLAATNEGCTGGGVSSTGKAVIARAEKLGMVLDLAHLSPQSIRDALEVLTQPVVVSHTGFGGYCLPPCNPRRNLSDEDIQAVAANGGVIGVGFWHEAVGTGFESVVGAVRYLATVLTRSEFLDARRRSDPGYDAYDHIAFGSDFDGSVTTPLDASGMGRLTTMLRHSGGPGGTALTPDQVARIAGLNVCRVYAMRLGGGSAAEARTLCRTRTD